MITVLEFEDKILKTDACWLWSGMIHKDGYGGISINRVSFKAHRVSYELYKGAIPEGMLVCHSCDVRNCVNPKHLFLGSHTDNMRDMKEKGRANKDKRGGGKPKLSHSLAIEIRGLFSAGVYNHRQLAERYNVGRAAIHNIILNKSWRS